MNITLEPLMDSDGLQVVYRDGVAAGRVLRLPSGEWVIVGRVRSHGTFPTAMDAARKAVELEA